MPYKRIGLKIYSKASGEWKLKQTAKNLVNAHIILENLEALESGKLKTFPSRKKHGKRT